jgi:hypothetical protein
VASSAAATAAVLQTVAASSAGTIAARDRTIAQLRVEGTQLRETAAAATVQAARTAQEMAQLETAAAAQRRQAAAVERTVAARDATIVRLEAAAAERGAAIDGARATAAARDSTIARLEAAALVRTQAAAADGATIASLRQQLEKDVFDVDAGAVTRAVLPPRPDSPSSPSAGSSGAGGGGGGGGGLQVLLQQQRGAEDRLRQVKQEKGVAEQQREEAQDRLECTMCMEKERTVVFVPCSHVVVCGGCAALVDDCPMCRQTIEQKLAVRLS